MNSTPVYVLSDIYKYPIKIVKSTLHESTWGPYLVMEDNKGRVIVAGSSTFIAQYANVPAPFMIVT